QDNATELLQCFKFLLSCAASGMRQPHQLGDVAQQATICCSWLPRLSIHLMFISLWWCCMLD
ncbi:UNVERIFIED_CONTAM: hypothetical protein NY603_37455, partial [Bacteroidetes bacterium 56_B9]